MGQKQDRVHQPGADDTDLQDIQGQKKGSSVVLSINLHRIRSDESEKSEGTN